MVYGRKKIFGRVCCRKCSIKNFKKPFRRIRRGGMAAFRMIRMAWTNTDRNLAASWVILIILARPSKASGAAKKATKLTEAKRTVAAAEVAARPKQCEFQKYSPRT